MDLDSAETKQRLPHLPPIRIIETAEGVEPGVRGTGVRHFAVADSYFEGHFPGHPILPGIYVIEAIAQTALIVISAGEGAGTASGMLARVHEMKFLQPITPGETIRFTVEVERKVGSFVFVSGVAKRDGEPVAEGRITVKVT